MLPLLLAVSLASSPLALQARRTLDFIYNMEFEAALKAAQTVIEMAPHHPAGYLYRTATYWQWRLITHQKSRRQALLAQFDTAVRRTLQMARRLPRTRAAEAAFYRGAAYGLQARMYAADKRYFSALQAAKRGGALLRQCVKLDADWHDAYFGLGLYHYFLDRVPASFRGIAQLLIGMQGDRDQGLRELEQARTQGQLAAPEAASALANIYALPTEKQYHKAEALLQELVQRYPKNFHYRFRLLFVSIHTRAWDQARRLSRELERDAVQGKPYSSRDWLPLLHYRTAETYVLQGNHAAALPLLQALHEQRLPDNLRAWVVLRLGNVQDLQSNRQAAQAYYDKVQGGKMVRRLAAQYRASPFTRQRFAVKPLEKII